MVLELLVDSFNPYSNGSSFFITEEALVNVEEAMFQSLF